MSKFASFLHKYNEYTKKFLFWTDGRLVIDNKRGVLVNKINKKKRKHYDEDDDDFEYKHESGKLKKIPKIPKYPKLS